MEIKNPVGCRMKPGAPRATSLRDTNARSSSEVVYPFGVQNDLGHVVLTRNAKVKNSDSFLKRSKLRDRHHSNARRQIIWRLGLEHDSSKGRRFLE